MKTLQQVREERAKLIARCKEIRAAAKAAEREDQLTDEEKREVDDALAKIDELTTEESRLEADEMRMSRIDAADAHQSRPAPEAHLEIRSQPEQQTHRPSNPAIPAGYTGTLRGFRGVDHTGMRPEERAYRAGQWLIGNTLSQIAAPHRVAQARQFCHDYGVRSPGYMEGEHRTAHAEDVNYLGGALVPPEFSNEVLKLVEEYGVFRRYARVVQMASDTKTVPRYVSGLTAYAVGEGDTITESNATWDNVNLVAKKWAVLTKHSTELAEDSAISIADELAEYGARAIAQKQDDCGFKGDGTSTYHGIYGIRVKIDDGTHTASIKDASSGDTYPSQFLLADLEVVPGMLPEFAGIRPFWFGSKVAYYNSVVRLLDALGGVTPGDVSRGALPQFLGYEWVFTNSLPTTLTATINTCYFLLGDLSMSSLIGERRGLTVNVLRELYAATDQIGITMTTRFDINNHSLGDTSNAGPVIGFVTPAS